MTTKTKTRKHPKPPKSAKAEPVSSGITGRYVYDRKTGRIVKVSDRVPSVASRRSSRPSCGEGPCGSGPCCGGGSCSD
ncbi:MAG: hypothetical protein KGL53_13200 [Elusimicrobia bacterium]|nr:hypothetical protein [Elusimicrobiota bacterium]